MELSYPIAEPFSSRQQKTQKIPLLTKEGVLCGMEKAEEAMSR